MTSPITKSPQDTAMLAACPFCGCKMLASKVFENSVGEWWTIVPAYCERHNHTEACPLRPLGLPKYATEAEAIAAWNTRNPPPGVEREAMVRLTEIIRDAMEKAGNENSGIWRVLRPAWAILAPFRTPPPPIEPDMVADEPPIGGEGVEARARGIARQVVANRKMQRDNGAIYSAALEAARTALSPAPADGGEDKRIYYERGFGPGDGDSRVITADDFVSQGGIVPDPVARAVVVERAEQIISAWAFAHNIDGAARNDLFKRLRTPDPIAESSQTEGEGI